MSIYTDTFIAVPFIVTDENESRGDVGRVVVHEIPGGNNSYVDLGGRSLARLSLSILIQNDANYSSLRSKVGLQGSLIYSEGTFTAVLQSLTRNTTYKSGQHLCTAEFLVNP